MKTSLWALGRVGALLLVAATLRPSTAQTIDLSKITPQCAGAPLFTYKPTSGTCEPEPTELAKIKSAAGCTGPSLLFKDSKCEAVPDKAPDPDCGDALTDLVFLDKRCQVKRTLPRSARGDFVGDCFEITAIPAGANTLQYGGRKTVRVLAQKPVGDDKELVVAESKGLAPFIGCTVVEGSPAKIVLASELERYGARRHGWTYGALVLPFKYFGHDKSLVTGLPFGGYLGWRLGTAGSAWTVAAGATVGQVKGEIKDADGKVTSTPDLYAFSITTGVMFDISKAPGVKPFKVGFFVGKDRVNADKVVNYPHNGRTWKAVQIGFDFTDN